MLDGSDSGGVLSSGYFNDNSRIDRLYDGERVDYNLQNLNKEITLRNENFGDTISSHSSYRIVLRVTDERPLCAIVQRNGDKRFSVRFENIEDAEASHGVLKDRIIHQADTEPYDKNIRKGGNLEGTSKYIFETSENTAKSQMNHLVTSKEIEQTGKHQVTTQTTPPLRT